ncbi:TPA: hypothetical protein DDW35_12370 [Candidatus Sumerlaeota bacterium]|nr:hypothetical protein [Candidatus Sumerlaeota bacterium]
MNKILQVTAAVAEQTREVTTASKEQSEGINQINSAIAQMDKVTQQVAANAEESASASEELSAQAQQMQGVVADLVNMVQASSTARERPNFELGYATTSPHPLPANRANSNMTLPYYSANEKRTLPRPENALHY